MVERTDSPILVVPRRPTNEPAAIWGQRLRELGDPIDFRVMQFDTPTSEPKRWLLPHENFDGALMMQFVLREVRGTDVGFPKLRDGGPPGLLQRLPAIWRMLRASKQAPMRWRRYDPEARGSLEVPLAHALFDVEEARAIAARAAERGAAMNSFLLWALDRAVHDEVAEPSPRHVWGVAVNMRGAVGSIEERIANVVVAIPIALAERGTPADAKSVIRERLEAKLHWGAWYGMRALAWFGADAIRRHVTRYYGLRRHASVGGFTSVGPYDGVDAGWIVVVPAALRTHPVGAGAVRVGGRLSIAIHVHPVLGPVDPHALVARWRGYLEGALAD